MPRPLLLRIINDLTAYLGTPIEGDKLDLCPDASVSACTAVRYRRGVDDHLTFLYHADSSCTADTVEEAEFSTWPPRPQYERPLSFSDQLIAVEDGEIDEDESTRAQSDDMTLLGEATEPREFADALREMLSESIDVQRTESFLEAGVLHHTPYESGFRITLENGETFVVTVTKR